MQAECHPRQAALSGRSCVQIRRMLHLPDRKPHIADKTGRLKLDIGSAIETVQTLLDYERAEAPPGRLGDFRPTSFLPSQFNHGAVFRDFPAEIDVPARREGAVFACVRAKLMQHKRKTNRRLRIKLDAWPDRAEAALIRVAQDQLIPDK